MPLDRYLGIVFSLPFIILFLVAIFHLILKLIRDRHAPVKTVGAVVIDKHKIELVSKYSGTGKTEKYVVVFLADGKKKAFYVSPFSYKGYHIKDKGLLTYRGDTLIGFK